MTQKHTLGPWTADFEGEDDYDGVPITAKDRDRYVPVANVPVYYADRPEREANARLIASAPELKEQRDELLEALEALLLQALQSELNSASHEYGSEAIDNARAAIAKAKGETL